MAAVAAAYRDALLFVACACSSTASLSSSTTIQGLRTRLPRFIWFESAPSPRRQRRAWRTNHCNLLGVLLWLHGERRLLHALGLLSQGREAAGSVPSSEATTGSPTLDVSSTLVRKSGREKKHRR